MITLVVLGITSLALLTAFSTSISASAQHRRLADFDTAIRSASASALFVLQQQASPHFHNCPADYSTLPVPMPTLSYTAKITQVEYWNGTGFILSCPPDATAPQRIQITVTGPAPKLLSAPPVYIVVSDPSFSTPSITSSEVKLYFTSQPPAGILGSPFAFQPVVKIITQSGNTATFDSTTPITLSAAGGTGTLTSCAANPVTVVSGVATFSGCLITGSGGAGAYTLTASGNSLSVTSTPFIVTGPPANLTFTVTPGNEKGPSSGPYKVTLAPQPQVIVQDSSNNTVTNNSSQITLALVGGPSGAKLTCDLNPVTASLGVANFTGCVIDKAGTYRLTATGAGFSVTSASFTLS